MAPTEAWADANGSADVGTEAAKNDEPKKVSAAPFWKMFSFADGLDSLLLIGGTLGATVNGASNPALCYVFGRMIDAVGGGPSMAEQVRIMLLVGGGAFLAAAIQGCCLRTFGQRQMIRMRRSYFEAILNRDVAWFDSRTVASLPAELDTDCEKMAEAFGDKFGQGVQGLFGFLISVILSFFLGWQLSLIVLAVVPVMTAGMIVFGNAMQEVAMETQSWYAQAAAVVEETLFAVRTVVAFGGERKALAKYEAAVKKAQAGARRNVYKLGFGMGWLEACFAFASAAALYYGMSLVLDGEVNSATGKTWTGGDIVIVFFVMLTGGFMLGQLEPAFKVMDEGRVAMGRYLEVVSAKSVIQVMGPDSRKHISSFERFEFRDVEFSYPAKPDVPVLQGISFKIEKGNKVAFVGESGSGKSTIMSLLERFYDPTGGAVLVNGEDAQRVAPKSLRALIGYVGQEPVLFATSLKNNILQGWPGATEADVQAALKTAQASFIDALPEGLETFAGSGGSQFSGGQKQRIAIARAILRKPQVLFLDEATSALDGQSEALIQETLDKIGAEGIGGGALTTVAIAHRLRTVRNSDTIFVMKGGRILEQGNHDELMALEGGMYQALAASQETRRTSQVGLQEAASPTAAAEEEKQEVTKTEIAKQDEKPAEEKKAKVSFARLLKYNRPEWPFFVPGVLGAAAHGAASPLQGYLLVSILDGLIGPKEAMKDEVTTVVIAWSVLAACLLVATIFEFSAFGILSEAMTARLRVAILESVFRQEVGFHDDPAHTPGLIGTALQLWAYRVKNYNTAVMATTEVVASLVTGLTIAFIGSWQMTLVMLCAIPVLVVASSLQMMFMVGGSTTTNDDMKVAQQVVSDSVQNARTVHAIGLEGALVQTYDGRIRKALKGYAFKAFVSGSAFGFSLAAPCFVLALGFWYSDQLVKDGGATFKGVMMAFMGVLYAGMGAGQATASMGDMKKAQDAYHSMFAMLDRKSLIDGLDPKGAVPNWVSSDRTEAGHIEYRAVEFAYPFRTEVNVLKGVNFEIKAGMSVGLVGPSGGGKSTIMALLQRFYDPSAGDILIGAAKMPLRDADIRWWRRQIGFVGQEPILFDATIRENALYGVDELTITKERLETCRQMAHLDFLDKLDGGDGWQTMVGARGGRLSGGQKQRIAICRALVRDPPVLLLDEATSALDSDSEKVVQAALEAARVGRTSVAIAHRLSTVQDCDLILVAADGVIVESGTHDELEGAGGAYSKLCRASGS